METKMSERGGNVMTDKRALVIEPHQGCRSLFVDILAGYGYEVTEAATAWEATAFLKNGPYAVVATSLLSANGPGQTLMKILRDMQPRPAVAIMYTDLDSDKIAGHEALGFGELVHKAASPMLLPQLLLGD